jgi:hypothetical protein
VAIVLIRHYMSHVILVFVLHVFDMIIVLKLRKKVFVLVIVREQIALRIHLFDILYAFLLNF